MLGPVIVAGSDGLAVRLAQELIALGEDVVVMAMSMEPRFRAQLERDGVRVLDGDARDVADLRAAKLETAAGLAIVDQNDVGNLHAALAARGERPDIPLVVRMFNHELGARLRALLPEADVLSASAIAAPAFVAAALRTSQRIVIAGRAFELRALAADDDLVRAVPLAAFDPHAGTATLFPAPALGVLALVPAEDVDEASVVDSAAAELRQAASFATSALTRGAALARLVIDRRLAVLLAVVGLIVFVSAVVWSASTRYNLLDSAYFVITTVSTVGYGDITPLNQSAALKLGVMGLMLAGALGLALIYALVTDAIVGVRLARSLGERPLPRRDHVVVLGLGRIGQRVVEELVGRRIPCIAVERNETAPGLRAARHLRVPVIVADAAAPEILGGLYLEHARCLMALTDDDAANLEAALNARAVRSDLRIVLRLFDHDLAQRVETAFSIHASRSVSSLAAPAFAAAISDRRALATIPIGAQALTVMELSASHTRTVAELEHAANGQARIIALGQRWAPTPAERPAVGDRVVAIGSPAGLAAVALA
jgi:Trk K+ transport system NAD-binding subunit